MNEMNQRRAIMTLCALPGIGPVRIGRLVERFGSPEAVMKASIQSLEEVRDIGPESAAAIANWSSHFDYRKEDETLAKLGARFVLKGEKGYPDKLAREAGAPAGLYVKGEFPEGPAIAIVGTRRPTLYGRHQAKLFASGLARAGICVVSGLARGIDGEAHAGALEAGGKTVAFLGSGIDVIYPPEHAELYARIAAQGAVVTEFALGKQPDPQSFPQRNRLISGVADAVLVVESDLRGGSMITARFAGEQGRLIFAMPGRIDQPSSHGCHALIRDGATLVTCVDDILDEMRAICPALRPRTTAQNPEQGQLQFPVELTDDERKILGALADGGVMNAEKIAATCVMSQQSAMAALLLLELKKLVARRADSSYEIRPS